MSLSDREASLRDEIVFLRLTNEGIGALGDLVPRGDGFAALVVAEKGYGLWVAPQEPAGGDAHKDEKFVLLKWQYLQTMVLPRRTETAQKGGKPSTER